MNELTNKIGPCKFIFKWIFSLNIFSKIKYSWHTYLNWQMSFEEDDRMADIHTQIYREIHVKQTKALLDTSGRKGLSKGWGRMCHCLKSTKSNSAWNSAVKTFKTGDKCQNYISLAFQFQFCKTKCLGNATGADVYKSNLPTTSLSEKLNDFYKVPTVRFHLKSN